MGIGIASAIASLASLDLFYIIMGGMVLLIGLTLAIVKSKMSKENKKATAFVLVMIALVILSDFYDVWLQELGPYKFFLGVLPISALFFWIVYKYGLKTSL